MKKDMYIRDRDYLYDIHICKVSNFVDKIGRSNSLFTQNKNNDSIFNYKKVRMDSLNQNENSSNFNLYSIMDEFNIH
jgi:hypothetical protein